MTSFNKTIEERIRDTLATTSDNETPNIAKLARKNNVPSVGAFRAYRMNSFRL